jgi:hypothetical protein
MTDDSRRCFVDVHITDAMSAGQSFTCQSWKQTARKNRHLLSLSPAVISRSRSWVMLLLVHVGPRATHFTGYCCWFTKVCGASGNTLYWVLLLVYVGSLHVGSRQHTSLGIVVGSCGASGNTLYWVLFFGLRGPQATHITGYCCWSMWGLGQHTLLGIVVGLRGALGNTLYWIWCGTSAMGLKYGFKIIFWSWSVDFRISSETAEANNTLTNKTMCHYSLFPN